MLCRWLSQLAHFTLTDGQVHDVTQARALIGPCTLRPVLGDKAYDPDGLLAYIGSRDDRVVIMPKTNRENLRTCDKHPCRSRNLIERFFANLKQFSRVVTRYDKLALQSASLIALAAFVIRL